MKKTVCELFAGVGGFRAGLEASVSSNDRNWNTVWFSQWEPSRKQQWAHDCYVNHYGVPLDLKGNDTTNMDISKVNKEDIPDHNLLVGGFPCQDYSVARGLSGEKGINGKKGVLWWDIREILAVKKAPFVLLENVDRLLKSPSTQRGRDFGIMLECFNSLGYRVEWRVINAAEYGAAQRRRRVFIFAYKNDTKYAANMDQLDEQVIMKEKGFFATKFPVEDMSDIKSVEFQFEINEKQNETVTKIDDKENEFILDSKIVNTDIIEEELNNKLNNITKNFKFEFQSAGYMKDGKIFTSKVIELKENPVKLGEILQNTRGNNREYYPVSDKYIISEERLCYSDDGQRHYDEIESQAPENVRKTWQYLKGGKKKKRKAGEEHEYIFSEGPIAFPDDLNEPSRTMLTSESSFNRSTHIVNDPERNKIRLITPIEAERLQGFDDNWTQFCKCNGEIVEMPEKMRYFCMGNALVVTMVKRMAERLNEIFDEE